MNAKPDHFGIAAGAVTALLGAVLAVQLLLDRPFRGAPLLTALSLILLGGGMIAQERNGSASLWLLALAGAAMLARALLFR